MFGFLNGQNGKCRYHAFCFMFFFHLSSYAVCCCIFGPHHISNIRWNIYSEIEGRWWRRRKKLIIEWEKKSNWCEHYHESWEYLMIICHRMEHKSEHFSCREMVSWSDKKLTQPGASNQLSLQCVRLRLFNETFTIVVFFLLNSSPLILILLRSSKRFIQHKKKWMKKKGIQRQ